MSKTVDQRVVEMQFDNKNFEKNVSTTMSTLDKFKQKLHLDGASKGLDTVGSSVDTLKMKFSALDVVGVTALTNITNSFVNAGKRVLDSFTLEPIRTGFNEYELKMGSIQTIMASTGESLDVVNQYLAELNKYSDDTIYSFKDMTSNIGKFTNAGVNLKDAVSAIKGVSNEAAISGANAEEASRAMYNFAQALSAGYVKLIDWKSIENANMATVSFKDELMKTALELGTVVQEGDKYISTTTDMAGKTSDAFDATHNFNDSLSAQWMTTDVLTKTLSRYADETTVIGKKATEAATKIKTFSMMMDTLKEAAQSGWAETWELIFGDFDQATALWTKLGTFFGDIIGTIDDARNSLIKGVLGQSSKWDDFEKKVNDAGVSTEDFSKKLEGVAKEHGIAIDDMIAEQGSLIDVIKSGKIPREVFVDTLKEFANAEVGTSEATEDMADKLEYFQNVVNDVWRGDFKNGEERIQALTDAGYEYSKVQDLVNKTVDGHKLTLEELSDVQLESVGYTEEQISALRQLAEEAEQSGSSIDKMLEQMNRPSGRELIFGEKNGILSNQLYNLKAAIDSIGKAFSSVFKKDDAVEGVYGFLKTLQEITYKLRMSDETAQNLEKTFKGVFTVFKLLSSILNAGIMIPFKILNGVLGSFNLHILDVTGGVGELVYQFGKWIQKCGLLNKGIDFAVSGIVKLINWIGKGYNKLTSIPIVSNNLNNLKSTIKDLFENSDKYFNAGKDTALGWINAFNKLPVISGAVSGVKGAFNDLIQLIKDIVDSSKNWTSFGDALKDISDRIFPKFQSASRATAKSGRIVAENISLAANKTEPAASKLSGAVSGVYETMKKFVDFVGNRLANLNLGKILATAFGATFVVAAVKTFTLVSSFSKLLDGVTGLLGSATGVVNNFGKALGNISKASKNVAKSMKFKAIGEMVWDMAKSFALIAAAVYTLSKLKTADLAQGLVALGIVIGAMVGLTIVFSKFPVKDTAISTGIILALSASLVIMSMAISKLSKLNFVSALGAVVILGLLITELIFALKSISKIEKPAQEGSKVMLALSVSMLLLSKAISTIATLKPERAMFATILIGALMLVMSKSMTIIGNSGTAATKGAAAILLMTVSMTLMVTLIKIVSGFTLKEIGAAILVIGSMIGLIVIMGKVMKTMESNGQYAAKSGFALLGISAAMLLMAATIGIISSISIGGLAKGIVVITAFSLICGLLIKFTSKAGNNATKAAVVILAFGVAMLAISTALFILSGLDAGGLVLGTAAIMAITGMLTILVKATEKSKDAFKNIMIIAITISAISGAIALLSLLDPKRVIPATLCIVSLMGMMVLVMRATEHVKKATGTILLMVGVVTALSVVLIALSQLPVGAVLPIATSLSELLLSMSAACLVLSKIKTFEAIPVIKALAVIFGATGLLLVIGGLIDLIPHAEEFLDGGVIVLNKFADAIGGFIGHLVGSLVGGMSTGIAEVGAKLTKFMENAQGFIQGSKNIDSGSMEGAKNLAEMILILTASDVLDRITSWLTGGDSITDFAKKLVPFGYAMTQFSKVIVENGGVDETAVNAAANAGRVMAEVAKIIPNTGGVASFFAGENDINAFGVKLLGYGACICEFSKIVSEHPVSTEAIQAAADAGKIMAEVANTIPNTGGVASFFSGDNSIDSFGVKLLGYGACIGEFSKIVSEHPVSTEAIQAAADAGSVMAEVSKAIPVSGGVAAFFSGDNSIDSFGVKLLGYGACIGEFSRIVTEHPIKSEAVNAAASAGKILAELANSIPKSGGLDSIFSGSNDIDSFGGKLAVFGLAIKSFAENTSSINTITLDAVTSQAAKLVDLGSSMQSFKSDGMIQFAKGLAALADANISGFINAFQASYDKVYNSIDGLMIQFAKAIGDARPNTRSAMDDVLNELITIMGERKVDFNNASTAFGDSIHDGLEGSRQNTRSAIDDILQELIRILGEWSPDFYTAGGYLAQGFANGISEDSWRAEAASKAMANQAYVAAQKELDEHSPSKKFKKVGAYVASGFAIGIASLGSKIKQSTRSMSQNAIDVMSESMSSVNHLLNGDMNVQPTIRPVLDLSSVQSEASNIGNLLNGNYRVGAMASSIATSQNSRVTVTNSDVVGAINRLRKDINEMPQGDTYRIDGITYDDGSNISSAVETLVRAATVGRRV